MQRIEQGTYSNSSAKGIELHARARFSRYRGQTQKFDMSQG
jgi:hypothetical protein